MKVPSEHKIKFLFKHLDKFIANGDNLDEAIGTSRHGKGKLPDPKEDIELLVDLLGDRFGETWEALQEPCELSKLASPEVGMKVEREKVGWALMWSHIPKLQEWVRNIVDKGELYEMPERPDDEDMIDCDEEGLVYEEGEDVVVDRWDGEDGYNSEDEAYARTKCREAAKRYTDHQYGKKAPSDKDQAAWVDRVAIMIFNGRQARLQKRTRAGAGGGAGGTDSSLGGATAEQVDMARGAAHQTLHEANHERRPNKILRDEMRGGVRHYLTRITDPGWAPPHRDEWRPRDWCLGFPGLVENYELVLVVRTYL